MTLDDDRDETLEALLEHIKVERGFDFTGYKRASLRRRVTKRMDDIGIDTFGEYLELLEVDGHEFTVLFNTILINVTRFFRDLESWAYLADEVIPRILAGKGAADPIRVWSAGCASGEEAYTIAILLAEALGDEEFRRRVKIYATDVDEDALVQARAALYDERALESLPEPFRARYFEADGDGFRFRSDLRRRVIFGRHDLVQDAPISRLDLLTCRNVLMYFNASAQAQIVAQMSFALTDGGFLFLGRAEMLLSHGRLFRPHDLPNRVFSRAGVGDTLRPPTPTVTSAAERERDGRVLVTQAFESAATPTLVVGRSGSLEAANGASRRAFGIDGSDVGRPLHDLEVSYRPAELRSVIQRSRSERREVTVPRVQHHGPTGPTSYDVRVRPLGREVGPIEAVVIEFIDHTSTVELEGELERSRQELETTIEELQSTSEELETTNEELQSTVEELETTNEELQSTNEELETMNEELQSTNDEQRAINDQLAAQSSATVKVNAYLESVLRSVAAAIIVVDAGMRVELWNGLATELWGLSHGEVIGQPMAGLDIGLPIAPLLESAHRCLASGEEGELVIDARDRRGRDLPVRARLVRTRPADGVPSGVTMLFEVLTT